MKLLRCGKKGSEKPAALDKNGKIRSLCTVAALIVLDKPNQLPGHITGALNYGWTKEEIVELITQMLFYGGYPTAVNSLAAAAKTFEEYDKRH